MRSTASSVTPGRSSRRGPMEIPCSTRLQCIDRQSRSSSLRPSRSQGGRLGSRHAIPGGPPGSWREGMRRPQRRRNEYDAGGFHGEGWLWDSGRLLIFYVSWTVALVVAATVTKLRGSLIIEFMCALSSARVTCPKLTLSALGRYQ